MRKKNWRLVVFGFFLAAFAFGFYLFMLSIAQNSTDPVALMQTAGGAAGVVIGISFIMVIIGLIGKKV